MEIVTARSTAVAVHPRRNRKLVVGAVAPASPDPIPIVLRPGSIPNARVATPDTHEVHWLCERRKSAQYGDDDDCPTEPEPTGTAMHATISRTARAATSAGEVTAKTMRGVTTPPTAKPTTATDYRQDGSGDATPPTDGEHQGAEGGHETSNLVNRRQPP